MWKKLMKINYNISEKVTCSHQGDPHSPLAGSRNKPPILQIGGSRYFFEKKL